MKYLAILAIVLSSEAFSATPVVNPGNFNCSELQSMLEENGELVVRRKVFGIPLKRRVAPSVSCKKFYYPLPAYFRTMDTAECEVGEYCRPEHNNRMNDNIGGP